MSWRSPGSTLPSSSGEPAKTSSAHAPAVCTREASRPSTSVLEAGYRSNYGEGKKANFTYLTATLDAATWGAELAADDGPGRIYLVEPTGPIENDPNLTDKKFPGNPTRTYRTRQPLRVVAEVAEWEPYLSRSPPGNAGPPRRARALRRRGHQRLSTSPHE